MRFFRTHRTLVLGTVVLALCIAFLQTPIHPPVGSIVVIEEGMSFKSTAHVLKNRDVIVSTTLFRIAAMFSGGAKNIKAGPYRFEERESIVRVARRLIRGEYGIEPERVFFREGLPSHEIATLLEPVIGVHEAQRFAFKAAAYEGRLFPDTYFVLPTATAEELIDLLVTAFDEKTSGIATRVASSSRSWNDVVTMASIIEEEARTRYDKRVVAGILWKRLDDGMRLQVDAPFVYLIGKASKDITREDLDMDSPYNTYKYEGLPPTPISNPGLVTLEATINPIETDYWFYLSDDDGNMHYAVTYDQHLDNKLLYID